MSEVKENGLLDFLKTSRTKDELKLCLDILQEFKDKESQGEWLMVPFMAWSKFEQFQDYLRLLTDTDVSEVNDQTAKKFIKTCR